MFTCRHTDRQIDRHSYTQIVRQIDNGRHRDRYRQTDTHRQRDRQTDKLTVCLISIVQSVIS